MDDRHINLAAAFVLLATTGCAAVPSFATVGATSLISENADLANKPALASAEPERLARVCLTTARQLAARGQDEAAIEQFQRANEFDPSIDVEHELAVLEGRLGHIREATRLFDHAIAASPKDGELRSDYGYFLYSTKRFDAAEKQLREAVQLTGSSTAKANLACVLAATKRYDEASTKFAEAEPSGDRNLTLALLSARAGDVESAQHFAEQAVAADPSDSNAKAVVDQLAGRSVTLTTR